nr:bifunctional pantoate--beta-alanine ligase/(d)CMP kinase [Oculatella sp. FACHB-28]
MVVRLFTTVAGLRCYLNFKRSEQGLAEQKLAAMKPIALGSVTGGGVTVGLVPTMGALHPGHLSLIHRARQDNYLVIVSIFVNPLQFGPNEDFQKYPRTLLQDQQQCEQAGVDVIFAPTAAELYGTVPPVGEALTQVLPPATAIARLCGRFRPGHFEGVATVVAKLLNLVQPDRTYFGQKDAQQLAILQQMVVDLNIPVEIVGCPIVREANGLALSSRNQYLTDAERSQATVLYRSLQKAEQLFRSGNLESAALLAAVEAELATEPAVKPQYAELVDPVTLAPLERVEESGLLAIAAYLGSTRLIDNLVLRNREPILAIDGPAGVGKSTVVRQVAQNLGLLYLDTGAMYRAVTWLVLQSGIALGDQPAIAELVSQCQIELENQVKNLPSTPRVWVNGQDVTQEIRSAEVTAHVSTVAAQPAVRRSLVKQQQQYGRKGGIVMDGRDIGTHVFPDAELKIFLTASVQERARRRQLDLKNQGQPGVSLEELERAIYERDHKDSTRSIAPLRKAEDAIEIQTDELTIDEVVAKIVSLYHQKLG